ncbi:TetR/AcrR family transcriptional regulator [Nocardia sp. CNY236]|uniref:TetR/AcrR family transcriptional regulator n=1 Tax=Nocardia sp. CNY236 TaxID=1169152 RepID=UPI00048ED968|nr:TetR/AcrR family transcriptional regulator [Nocardia sp. CNY236]
MARQQERARRTRAAIIRSAAVEFGKSGYAAASLNRILEGSRATKGAMYFHFDSKEDLARAVLGTAVERYRVSAERWLARVDLSPLDVLHGMVDEIALRLEHDIIAQAEYRLIIEPDFYCDVQMGGGRIVGRTTKVLADRAIEYGQLRADADPNRFTRTLAAALAGQRYMADLLGGRVDLRSRFEESLEVVIEAMATLEWLEKFQVDGWCAQARVEDLSLGL